MGNTCFLQTSLDVIETSNNDSEIVSNSSTISILDNNIINIHTDYDSLVKNKINYDILLNKMKKVFLDKRYMIYDDINKKYYRATLKNFFPQEIRNNCYDQLTIYNSDKYIDYNNCKQKYKFQTCITSMPLNFISKIESLSDILLNKLIFNKIWIPYEILDIIDEYL